MVTRAQVYYCSSCRVHPARLYGKAVDSTTLRKLLKLDSLWPCAEFDRYRKQQTCVYAGQQVCFGVRLCGLRSTVPGSTTSSTLQPYSGWAFSVCGEWFIESMMDTDLFTQTISQCTNSLDMCVSTGTAPGSRVLPFDSFNGWSYWSTSTAVHLSTVASSRHFYRREWVKRIGRHLSPEATHHTDNSAMQEFPADPVAWLILY